MEQINKTFAEVRTISEALQCKAPSLYNLSKEVDRNMLETLLKMHIVALDIFLKQKDGLTIGEIELIVDEIMSAYSHLSFADINVIFRNAKIGKYGDLYQQLSCAKIIRWFEMYANERADKALDESLRDERAENGIKPDPNTLRGLGYKVDENGNPILDERGRPMLDKDVIKENNDKRKAIEEERKRKIQWQIDKDNGFMKWKAEYLKSGKL